MKYIKIILSINILLRFKN